MKNYRQLWSNITVLSILLIFVWQVSYMILELVSPVTHAVGNCVKRLVVIVSSIIFFQTPVSPTNSLGKFPLPIGNRCKIVVYFFYN